MANTWCDWLRLAVVAASVGSTEAASIHALHYFPSNSGPSAPLVQGRDGAFYGTTLYGGLEQRGSVYKVTTNGVFTELASFNFLNGAHPFAGLLLGADGDLYGTTATGGVGGSGTVFRISTAGGLETVAAFFGTNGQSPRSLVDGGDGFLYGTTVAGGVYTNENGHGYGTVFRVSTSGLLETLVCFARTNGWSPLAGLVRGDDEAFYGTTRYGGACTNDQPYGYGYGTVFKVTRDGRLTTLHSFSQTNGAWPFPELTKGKNGMFYGTTSSGGSGECGTVFEVSANGDFRTLYAFTREGGMYPEGGLVEGNDGAFYGTTAQGSFAPETFSGTVFRVTTNGALSALYSLRDEMDGRWPSANLVQGPDHAFYGTCRYGGPQNGGSVFRLDLSVTVFCSRTNEGSPGLTFQGLPATLYSVLRAPSIAGPWATVATIRPPPNGSATWVDSAPPSSAFYRTEIPVQ